VDGTKVAKAEAAGAVNRVARWLSLRYRTLAVPVSLAQTVELFTHALSGRHIAIHIIPDKEPKYRTVIPDTWQP